MFPYSAKSRPCKKAALGRNFVERTETSQNFLRTPHVNYRRRLGFSSSATASTCGDHRNWSIGVTLFS